MDALLEPQEALLGFRIDIEQRPLHLRCGSENSGHAIVLGRAHGVYLMVVTSRARRGEAEQTARYSVDALVPIIGGKCQQHIVRESRVLMRNRTEPEVSQGSPVAARNARHLIRRKLQFYKPVVGNILVHRLDHPIAITPGVRIIGIRWPVVLIVFGIPSYIEPIASPSLAIVRGSEQSVDQPLVRVGRS